MSGVPKNADVLAAFLYWETITAQNTTIAHAKFRGIDVTVNTLYKKTPFDVTPSTAPCWSSGGGSGAVYTMNMNRADVVRRVRELKTHLAMD